MVELVVVDVQDERRLVALVDRFRRYYVARVSAELPLPEATVSGPIPQRGLALLNDHRTGQVYRVHFEAVDCGEAVAFNMLRQSPLVSA